MPLLSSPDDCQFLDLLDTDHSFPKLPVSIHEPHLSWSSETITRESDYRASKRNLLLLYHVSRTPVVPSLKSALCPRPTYPAQIRDGLGRHQHSCSRDPTQAHPEHGCMPTSTICMRSSSILPGDTFPWSASFPSIRKK
jgi:hypothetical protein